MILYLDMDGVIVDFNGRVYEMVGHTNPTQDEVRTCMKTPRFFRNLPPYPEALTAVHTLMALLPGKVRILSAVPHSEPSLAPVARKEKLEWLRQYLPALANDALIVSSKANITTDPEDILLDDRPDWNGASEFGGRVITFTGPSDWDTVIQAVTTHESSMVKVSRIFRKRYALSQS